MVKKSSKVVFCSFILLYYMAIMPIWKDDSSLDGLNSAYI